MHLIRICKDGESNDDECASQLIDFNYDTEENESEEDGNYWR